MHEMSKLRILIWKDVNLIDREVIFSIEVSKEAVHYFDGMQLSLN